MNRRFTEIEKVSYSALLTAIAVVLGSVSKFIVIPHFGSFLSFSFTPSIVLFASLALGPVYGAIVGALADFLPAMLVPTGAYNFLLTITYALLGFLPWFLERLTRRFRSAFSKPWIVLCFLLLEYAAVIYFFYGTSLLDQRFDASWLKALVLAINGALDVGLLVVLSVWNHHLQKQGKADTNIPSLYEMAFLALILDFALLVLMKAMDYDLYFILFASNKRYSYWLFVAMLLMTSPIQVAMMAILCPWWLTLLTRLHPEKSV